MKKIILTGGGTAGHVMPNLALIPRLKAFDEIHYIGSVGGMEEGLVRENAPQVVYHSIPCVKFVRSLSLKNLAIPFGLIKSVNAAKKILKEVQPDVIFSKGGYVGLPVCFAAKRIPVVLHESDLKLGLANKLALSKCDKILTSFETDLKKAVKTGAPLREEIYRGNRLKALNECGLCETLPYLLVTGGSKGAKAINETVFESIDALTERFNVIHLVGKGNANGLKRPGYYQKEFASDMADWLALCDFALCRGGANTLFELATLGVPALIIPLPKTVSRGDQIDNALYFNRHYGTKILFQEDMNKETLIDALDGLKADAAEIKSALSRAQGIDGTRKIAEILTDYVEK